MGHVPEIERLQDNIITAAQTNPNKSRKKVNPQNPMISSKLKKLHPITKVIKTILHSKQIDRKQEKIIASCKNPKDPLSELTKKQKRIRKKIKKEMDRDRKQVIAERIESIFKLANTNNPKLFKKISNPLNPRTDEQP